MDYIESNIENHVVQIVEEMPVIERNNQQIMIADLAGEDKVLFTTTDIALAFGRRRSSEINKFLCRHGIIKPCTVNQGWTMTERYEPLSLCSYETMKFKGQIIQYIHWNERGVKFIVNFLKAKGLKQIQPVRRDPTFRRKENKNKN